MNEREDEISHQLRYYHAQLEASKMRRSTDMRPAPLVDAWVFLAVAMPIALAILVCSAWGVL